MSLSEGVEFIGSLDAAQRNPGFVAYNLDYAALHPGYGNIHWSLGWLNILNLMALGLGDVRRRLT